MSLHLSWWFLGLAFALTLAGCSSSGDQAFPAAAEPTVRPTTAPTATPTPQVVDLAAGLVGHFPFDGGGAPDALGITDSQTIGTEMVPDRNGVPNGALRFNGLGDFVQYDNASALNVAQDFSIAVWVERGESIGSDWYSLFEKSDPERGGHSRYGLWLRGAKPAACFEADDNSRQPCSEADEDLPAGWHHVAAVRTGRRLILYVDGVEVANDFVGLYPVSQTDFNAFSGTDRYEREPVWFDGSLDELRIYDRGLSPIEITLLAEQ